MAERANGLLENRLEEAQKEVAYYKKLSRESGIARLREAEELSLLVKRLKKVEHDLQQSKDELEFRVEERTAELARANDQLRKEIEERKKAEDRVTKINKGFLKFGADPIENIKILTALCGELLEATSSVYNRFDLKLVYSWGEWNLPNNYEAIDNPEGQIFYDVIKKARDSVLVIFNLHEMPYAQIDPHVIPNKLQTCMARAVRFADAYKGALCVFYQDDHVPSENDKRLIEIISSAIGVEEDRYEAVKALSRSEERFREMADNICEVFWLFDWKEQRVVYVNSAYEKIWGRSVEALYQRYDEWAESIHPDDITYAQDSFAKILETGGGEPREYRIVRPDGTICWISDKGFAISGEDGEAIRIAGIAEDITERKHLEDQLQQSQKMEAIATLAGGIAHQFNNALSGIIGNIEMLQWDIPDDENIRKHIEPMKHSAQRMTHLTGQLLAYAQGGKYQERTISLNDFIRETLPLVEHLISSSVYIDTDLPMDILPIKADLTQMQMVLSAVLSNSSEAMEGGMGRVRISTSNKKIDATFSKSHPGLEPGPYVCLTIEDNGRGMDETTKGRLFEPFFSTKFQGRGLGMAAVYGIIKNHNGSISVDSKPGAGTTVRIHLPALVVDKEETETENVMPIKGKGTILVVEDEQIVMDVSMGILEMMGYRTLGATTGKEAVSVAEKFEGHIDLALLDMVLPDMGAKDVYRLLIKAHPNMKVILCSGYSIDGPAQEILDEGAHDFIQKPFSVSTISEKLNRILEAE
ncbi:MAG: PAS domain-containing protein [Deltaproteobacteria bacterium]|nr:PAS domain-containing protein [Deltaproteobacteria bacterium]